MPTSRRPPQPAPSAIGSNPGGPSVRECGSETPRMPSVFWSDAPAGRRPAPASGDPQLPRVERLGQVLGGAALEPAQPHQPAERQVLEPVLARLAREALGQDRD